ncbi:hypothetical protein [Chromatium okenii]|uniref:hypothetical protein n=1 Tax=Chromatium okenii TaxID=61644 RepID=UPI001F5B2A18|nr:hypothetical protein [Chromatium okenii]
MDCSLAVRGVGKRLLAEQLAHSCCVHCDHDGVPCGTCADCHLLAAGTHPDLTRLGPDPEAKSNSLRLTPFALSLSTNRSRQVAHRAKSC